MAGMCGFGELVGSVTGVAVSRGGSRRSGGRSLVAHGGVVHRGIDRALGAG